MHWLKGSADQVAVTLHYKASYSNAKHRSHIIPSATAMSPDMTTSTSKSLRTGLCIDIPTPQPNAKPPEECISSASSAFRIHEAIGDTIISAIQPKTEEQSALAGEGLNDGQNLLPYPPTFRPHVSLRSSKGMQGLILAETGSGLVELDPLGGGSGFKQGTLFMPGLVTPRGGAPDASFPPVFNPSYPSGKIRPSAANGQRLRRQATLLSHGVTPARNAAELKSLLGNSRSKIKSGAQVLPPSNASSHPYIDPVPVTMEQGTSRARVEVDILLESEICVEGGYLTGALHVKVRKRGTKKARVLLGAGKVRVVGFEGIPDEDDRHTFYQHAVLLSTISSSSHELYVSPPDEEGFSEAREGNHTIPFAMKLPVSDGIHVGPKGPFDNRSGVVVKYIVIASFKLKDTQTSKHSIAHFYRSCELYPLLDLSAVLAPASNPLLSTAARSLFLGGTGKLKLTASFHRNIWVAGQRCCVGITVHNETTKSVKSLRLSLIRTTTVFYPRPQLDIVSSSSVDPEIDACQTKTTRRLVTETTLEAGQRGLRGHVTAKGWWTGVDPGARMNFTHFILLPSDALSIVRSRLVEVHYAIRVSLVTGSLSSEVSVMLPIRIISHFSIDPPPGYLTATRAPVPALPIPIPDSDSTISTALPIPRYASVRDLRNGERLVEEHPLISVFDDPDANHFESLPGVATVSPAVSRGPSPMREPVMMSGFAEEDTVSCARRVGARMHFHSDRCGTPEATQIGDPEGHSGEHGEEHAAMPSHADDPEDILDNLYMTDSDSEVDFLVGSTRLENNEFTGNYTQFAGLCIGDQDQPFAVQEHKSFSSSHSSLSAGDLAEDLGITPRLPRQHSPCEMLTPVAHPRSRLRPKIPEPHSQSFPGSQVEYSKPPPPLSSNEHPTQAGSRVNTTETSKTGCIPIPRQPPKKSIGRRSPFSQKVERLVAARHTATRPPIPRTATESEGADVSTEALPEASLIPTRIFTRTEFPLQSRRLSGAPSSLSNIAAPNRPAMMSCVSNSVRSRIAQLEGISRAVPVDATISVRPYSYRSNTGVKRPRNISFTQRD